jgi:hypothetical protein
MTYHGTARKMKTAQDRMKRTHALVVIAYAITKKSWMVFLVSQQILSKYIPSFTRTTAMSLRIVRIRERCAFLEVAFVSMAISD